MEIEDNQKSALYADYLKHQQGFLRLWMWMHRWESLKGANRDWAAGTIALSTLCARRFGLGVLGKSRKSGGGLFLGLQKEEMEWFRGIPWKRSVIDSEAGRLWLVTQAAESPDEFWPDLPAVAIGIPMDSGMLAAIRVKKIAVRSLWSEDGRLRVGAQPHETLVNRTGSLDDHWPRFERSDVLSLNELILKRLDETSVSFDPGYQGAAAAVPDMMRGYVDFKPERPAAGIESSRPDLFGQFLDNNNDSDKMDS